MPFVMGPVKQPDSGTGNPPLANGVANTSDVIYAGSALVWTSGVLRLAATNPVAGTLVGFAAADNNTSPGYNMGNQPSVVGFGQNIVPYYLAMTSTVYRSHLVNNSDTYITPVITDVGLKYGLRKNTDGEVVLDKNITSTTALAIVTRIDTEFQPSPGGFVEWTLDDSAILV